MEFVIQQRGFIDMCDVAAPTACGYYQIPRPVKGSKGQMCWFQFSESQTKSFRNRVKVKSDSHHSYTWLSKGEDDECGFKTLRALFSTVSSPLSLKMCSHQQGFILPATPPQLQHSSTLIKLFCFTQTYSTHLSIHESTEMGRWRYCLL